MKAIVFATDQVASDYRIKGLSSPFFNLQGRPILLYVLVALDQLADIEEVVIIGPPSQIMSVLEAALFEVPFSKKITVLPQKGQLLEDLQSAISGGLQQAPDPLQVLPPDEAVLCLPGNIPLITTAEIEAFLATSDMDCYDYCIGITEENALLAFYPEGEKSGIKKSTIQLKDKRFRLNNLHLIRPLKIGRVAQGESSGKSATASGWPSALPPYMASLFDDLLSKTGQEKILGLSPQDSTIEIFEDRLSDIFQLKLRFTGRWKGGAALNIDDEACYQAISERIDDWRTLIADLNQTEEGKKKCPTSGLACKSE